MALQLGITQSKKNIFGKRDFIAMLTDKAGLPADVAGMLFDDLISSLRLMLKESGMLILPYFGRLQIIDGQCVFVMHCTKHSYRVSSSSSG